MLSCYPFGWRRPSVPRPTQSARFFPAPLSSRGKALLFAGTLFRTLAQPAHFSVVPFESVTDPKTELRRGCRPPVASSVPSGRLVRPSPSLSFVSLPSDFFFFGTSAAMVRCFSLVFLRSLTPPLCPVRHSLSSDGTMLWKERNLRFFDIFKKK
eukprot:RCo010612